MQSLTNKSKGKQICMHDREAEMGRQMEEEREWEAKRGANSLTSLELVCVSMHVLKVDVSVLEHALGRRGGLRAK